MIALEIIKSHSVTFNNSIGDCHFLFVMDWEGNDF